MTALARLALLDALTTLHLGATATYDQKTYQGYRMSVPATSMPQTCAFSYQDYHMARGLG